MTRERDPRIIPPTEQALREDLRQARHDLEGVTETMRARHEQRIDARRASVWVYWIAIVVPLLFLAVFLWR
jgi:hypothetical protein